MYKWDLEKAIGIHSNKYDYSKVIYNGDPKQRITIVCPVHGEFQQSVNRHMLGSGCQKCGIIKAGQHQSANKLTQDQFVGKATQTHGGKYDYSKVVYTNSRAKIKIVCPEHGEFEQRAGCHLRGDGCPKCGLVKAAYTNILKKVSVEQFIDVSRKIHGQKYDYSKVKKFDNTKNSVTIICPIHGEFQQMVASHMFAGKGCIECGRESASKLEMTSFGEFVGRSCRIHSNKYDYSLSEKNYSGLSSTVTIICPIHGEFKQKASHHLKGCGCQECGRIKSKEYSEKRRLTTEQFILRAKSVHGDKYDYGQTEYQSYNKIVEIFCKKCAKSFFQTPHAHLSFYGCRRCHDSVGERKIENWLDKYGIEYEREKRFVDCKNGKWQLPFDFYLKQNNSIIECDGVHHFKPITNSQEDVGSYNKIVENDKIKNEYCRSNGINLIRIKYSDISKIDDCLGHLIIAKPPHSQFVKPTEHRVWLLDGGIHQELCKIDKYLDEQYWLHIEGSETPWVFKYDRLLTRHKYNLLRNATVTEKSKTNYCVEAMEFHNRHLWFMNNGKAIEYWENNMSEVIDDRIRYAKLSPRDLRRFFKIRYMVPNLFQDSVAKFMASQIDGNLIYDPFAGFGGRMIGACSAGKKYIGMDLNRLNVNGNLAIKEVLSLDADVLHGDSSTHHIECDGVITSPPFFNKDDYGVGKWDSLELFQEFIFGVFSKIKTKTAIIDFKGSKGCSVGDFEKALPFKHIEKRLVNFGGIAHNSYHTWFYCRG